MNQNIIGLVLKTGGYPEPVTVSGCHGNQAKFKISISKKFLKKFRHYQKTVYRQNFYSNSLVMGIFMRPTTISNYGNHLLLIEAPERTIPYFATISKTGHYFATRGDKFFPNLATYNYSSKVCHFTVCLTLPSAF